MFSLKPREDEFFVLFKNAVNNAKAAAIALNNLTKDYTNADAYIEEIINIERQGDTIKYEIEKKLADSFITPFDREDIYMIAKKIDRFVNDTLTSALRFKMLHIDEINYAAQEITEILINASDELILLFEKLSMQKKLSAIKEHVTNVNKYESRVDDIFRNAVTELFDNPKDLLHVIKWKEIYQHLEDTADSCEDIANSIGGVVTKNE